MKLPLVSDMYCLLRAQRLYWLLFVLAVPIAPVQAKSFNAPRLQPLELGADTLPSNSAVMPPQKQAEFPEALATAEMLRQRPTESEARLAAPASASRTSEWSSDGRPIARNRAIALSALVNVSPPAKSQDDFKKVPKSAAPLLSDFLAVPEAAPARSSRHLSRTQSSVRPGAKPLMPNDATVAERPSDPELGVIEVGQVSRDDELGVIQLRSPLQDPELGILELRQIAPPTPRSPLAYLSTFVAASSSDNIFLFEDPIQGRFGDQLVRPGISILAFPTLGPDTGLLLSARTTLFRYQEQTASNYDEVRFQAGIRQRLSANAYGELSLSHQLLYEEGFTEQFFTNTGIDLTLGRRDRLTPQLTLDSYYQGQIFFSDPERFSNVLNSVGASLNYEINSQWDAGIGYRLTISDFTQQSRHEAYQRLTGQLRYAITPEVRLSLFGGLSYGRSSESRVTFDDTFFGLSINATVPIF